MPDDTENQTLRLIREMRDESRQFREEVRQGFAEVSRRLAELHQRLAELNLRIEDRLGQARYLLSRTGFNTRPPDPE